MRASRRQNEAEVTAKDHRPLRPGATAAVAIMLIGALAACGDDGDSSDDDKTTTTEAGGSTDGDGVDEGDGSGLSAEEAEQEVLDAYDAAIQARIAAYDPPDPEHPDLLDTHAGESLFNQQDAIRDLQARGVSWVGGSNTWSGDVKELSGDNALIRVCSTEDMQEIDTETREEKAVGDMVLQHDNHMERIEGIWKVAIVREVDAPCTVG